MDTIIVKKLLRSVLHISILFAFISFLYIAYFSQQGSIDHYIHGEEESIWNSIMLPTALADEPVTGEEETGGGDCSCGGDDCSCDEGVGCN